MNKKRTKAELQAQLEKQTIILMDALVRSTTLTAWLKASTSLDSFERDILVKLSSEVSKLINNALPSEVQ